MPINNCNQRDYSRSCQTTYELDSLPLAMAYVPWQHFHNVYEVDKALGCGTIFPELYKPFLGKRGVCR